MGDAPAWNRGGPAVATRAGENDPWDDAPACVPALRSLITGAGLLPRLDAIRIADSPASAAS